MKDCAEESILTLASLPVGRCARVTEVLPGVCGARKLADMGLVPGAHVRMEGHAPFGGLIRIKLLGACLSLHSREARHFVLSSEL